MRTWTPPQCRRNALDGDCPCCTEVGDDWMFAGPRIVEAIELLDEVKRLLTGPEPSTSTRGSPPAVDVGERVVYEGEVGRLEHRDRDYGDQILQVISWRSDVSGRRVDFTPQQWKRLLASGAAKVWTS